MENKIEQNTTTSPAEKVEEVKTTENTNTKDKKDQKGKKQKKPRRPFKVVMKTWSKGLAKETGRITWEKKLQVIKDFVVILVVSVILAALFFGIDMIIITIRK